VKKEKEIQASFAVTSHIAKVTTIVTGKYLVKNGKKETLCVYV
jgi:hypothetical protein